MLHNYIIYYSIFYIQFKMNIPEIFYGDTEVLEMLTFVVGLLLFTSFLFGEQFGWGSW